MAKCCRRPVRLWRVASRNPGVLPPPAERHRGVRRAEDGVLPEPEGGGQRPAVLPAERAEPGEENPTLMKSTEGFLVCDYLNLLVFFLSFSSRKKKFATCSTLHLSRTSFPESTSKVRRSRVGTERGCLVQQKKVATLKLQFINSSSVSKV